MLETLTGRADAVTTESDDAETDLPTPEASWATTVASMGTVEHADEETPAWLTALAAAGGIVVGVGVGVSSWWHLSAADGPVGSLVLGLGLLVALAFAVRAEEALGLRGRF